MATKAWVIAGQPSSAKPTPATNSSIATRSSPLGSNAPQSAAAAVPSDAPTPRSSSAIDTARSWSQSPVQAAEAGRASDRMIAVAARIRASFGDATRRPRATPRTQAALLEAMAESSVTIDGVGHLLKPPFLLIGTQNPIDHEGTFPLPEAQLDRFLIKLSLGYPSLEEESQMLEMMKREHPLDKLQPVMTAEELVMCQRAVRTVHVDPKVRNYITQIVHASRKHHDVRMGGSPRASIALYRASQAVAAIRGRNYVEPDDVKHILPSVLTHRMILRPEARLQNVTAEELVVEILDSTPVPVLEGRAAAAGG